MLAEVSSICYMIQVIHIIIFGVLPMSQAWHDWNIRSEPTPNCDINLERPTIIVIKITVPISGFLAYNYTHMCTIFCELYELINICEFMSTHVNYYQWLTRPILSNFVNHSQFSQSETFFVNLGMTGNYFWNLDCN